LQARGEQARLAIVLAHDAVVEHLRRAAQKGGMQRLRESRRVVRVHQAGQLGERTWNLTTAMQPQPTARAGEQVAADRPLPGADAAQPFADFEQRHLATSSSVISGVLAGSSQAGFSPSFIVVSSQPENDTTFRLTFISM